MLRKLGVGCQGSSVDITVNYLPLQKDFFEADVQDYSVTFSIMNDKGEREKDSSLSTMERYRVFWDALSQISVEKNMIVFDGLSKAWSFNMRLPELSLKTVTNEVDVFISIKKTSPKFYSFNENSPDCLAVLQSCFVQSVTLQEQLTYFIKDNFIYPIPGSSSKANNCLIGLPCGIQLVRGVGIFSMNKVEFNFKMASFTSDGKFLHPCHLNLVHYAHDILKYFGFESTEYDWSKKDVVSKGILKLLNDILSGACMYIRKKDPGAIVFEGSTKGVDDYIFLGGQCEIVRFLSVTPASRKLHFDQTVQWAYQRRNYKILFPYSPLVLVRLGSQEALVPMEMLCTTNDFLSDRATRCFGFYSYEHLLEGGDEFNLLKFTIADTLNFQPFLKKIFVNKSFFVEMEGRQLSAPTLVDSRGNIQTLDSINRIPTEMIKISKNVKVAIVGMLFFQTVGDHLLPTANPAYAEHFQSSLSSILVSYGVKVEDQKLIDVMGYSNRPHDDCELPTFCKVYEELKPKLESYSTQNIFPIFLLYTARNDNLYGLCKIKLDRNHHVSQVMDGISMANYMKSSVYDKSSYVILDYMLRILSKLDHKLIEISFSPYVLSNIDSRQILFIGACTLPLRNGSSLTSFVCSTLADQADIVQTTFVHFDNEKATMYAKEIHSIISTVNSRTAVDIEHIILYRNQKDFKHINKYYDSDSEAFKYLKNFQSASYGITYISVVPMPYLSFYVAEKKEAEMRYADSGAVIDAGVVAPDTYEFLLHSRSHLYRSQTFPVCYRILWNDRLTMDEIQGITYQATFTKNSIRQLKIPFAAEYAWMLARKTITKWESTNSLTRSNNDYSKYKLEEIKIPRYFFL